MAAREADQLDLKLIDEIADRLVDAITERVIEAFGVAEIAAQTPAATAWLDANEVAQRLRVKPDWVYEHADELGASRIGNGPRPRLRFPPDVMERQCGQRPSFEAAGRPAKPRPKTTGLIPIRAS